MSQYTPRDVAALAAIVFGEARGEPLEGRVAVAHVVRNRASRLGASINEVVHDRHQFTAVNPNDVNREEIERAAARNTEEWQSALDVARSVLSGETPDPTNGADHYYNPRDANPRWGRGHSAWSETAEIGGHVFGRSSGVPNPSEQFPQLDLPEAGIETAQIGDPLAQRTLGAVVDGTSGYVLKNDDVDVQGLTPQAQSMLSLLGNSSGLPELTVTSGVRTPAEQAALRSRGLNAPANSRHVVGRDAIDVRARDLTDAERARALDVAIAGGARGIGFYGSGGRHLHFDTRDDFSTWPRTAPAWAQQSEMFQRLQRGENPRVSTMVPTPTARPANASPPPTAPQPIPSAARTAIASNAPARAAPVTPVETAGLPNISPSAPYPVTPVEVASLADVLPSAPRRTGLGVASAPVSTPSMRVSPQGSYGTPVPRRSPDQFQYAGRTPAPPQRSPAPVGPPPAAPLGSLRGAFSSMGGVSPRAPAQAPSRAAMLDNYRARALEDVDPFGAPTALTPEPPSVPGPVVPPASAPPMTLAPNVGRPMSLAGQPMPLAPPAAQSGRAIPGTKAFSRFTNDMTTPGGVGGIAGGMLGGLAAGPLGAAGGGLLGRQLFSTSRQAPVTQPTYGPVKNTGAPARPGSVTSLGADRISKQGGGSIWDAIFGNPRRGGRGGTGASAHDAWSDSLTI